MKHKFIVAEKNKMLALHEYWQTPEHDKRVQVLEAEDMTTSDAQAVADAEFLIKWSMKT